MGGVLTVTTRQSSEREAEEIRQTQSDILAAKLHFFRTWLIDEVEFVFRHFRSSGQLYQPQEATGVRPEESGRNEELWDFEASLVEWQELFHVTLDADEQRQLSTSRKPTKRSIRFRCLDALRERRRQRQWHPAVTGYAMMKCETAEATRCPASEEVSSTPRSHHRIAGHTDDEESDEETGQDSVSSDEEKDFGRMHEAYTEKRHQSGELHGPSIDVGFDFDPGRFSPVFFGYTSASQADVGARLKMERIVRESEETRIVEKQKARRTSDIKREREEAHSRKEARERKVATLEAEFERGRKQRLVELETAKKVMTPREYAPIAKQWSLDEESIIHAHQSEIAERKRKFAFLNREDIKHIQDMLTVAKYAENAENSTIPRGAQLEALARAEVERLVGEIDVTSESVKEAQNELLAAQELRKRKGEARAGKVVDASIILLEGRVAASEKDLGLLVQQLQESECMLKRARRIRSKEDLVLPLYKPLAENAEEGDYRASLFSILCALALASSDTLWEKLTFITGLFDVKSYKFMHKAEVCALLAVIVGVLNSFKMVEVKASREELESVVTRAFVEERLDHSKGMTVYEVKSWMASMVARSQRLSEIFGTGWTFGQMSAVMRYRMSMVHEFELGMISMVDLKHKVARKLIKYKRCLQKESIQSIHDRAMAMGDEDPLKPNYSHFLLSAKRSSFSNAVPLRHGHLENYTCWRDIIRVKTATKIQNLFRGKLARKEAEAIAKKHAFLCARTMALEDTRQRITAEIWKREAASGVARLKWDAKVRMKQAKLRTVGDHRSREEVIRLIVEESVEAAQLGVVKRFDEIAKERGLHNELQVEQTPSSATEEDFLSLGAASSHASQRTKAAGKLHMPHLLKMDLQYLRGQIVGREAVVDLGLPQTPRKIRDGNEVTVLPGQGLIVRNGGHDSVKLGEIGQSALQRGAHVAGSTGVLSSGADPHPKLHATDLDSATVGSHGPLWTIVSQLIEVRKQLMMLGLFPSEWYDVGETFEEIRLRMRLADPDPPSEELLERVRTWSAAMTELKTKELLAELPTKRLLMKYVHGFVDRAEPPGDLQALATDLSDHFQLARNAREISCILVNLLKTDFAFGLATESLQTLQGQQDVLLARMAQRQLEEGMAEAEAGFMRRLNAAKVHGTAMEEVEETQARKTTKEATKRLQSIADAKAAISKNQGRLRTAEQELFEIRRRETSDRAFKHKAEGLSFSARIREEHRYDWTGRYTSAMAAAEDSEESLQAKYMEITNVCNDFLETAKHVAMTIIDEDSFDLVHKTLQPVAESECHGRSVEGNRGRHGRRQKFEAFNIRFKVCTDDHGIFNGNDDCAAKGYGGREVSGALEYMKQHRSGLIVPLTCAIDYHGFRILAVAKVPINTPVFTGSGKIRHSCQNMVHGTPDGGGTILNESRLLNNMLQDVAEKLNLSLHLVKGARMLNSKALWASADLRAYRTGKQNFFLLNFWRTFPPEDPAATPHLKSPARGQSIMWRGLRPELVRSNVVPLSPDANFLVTHGAPDWRKQRDDVRQATCRLVEEVIPGFAEDLCRKTLRGIEPAIGSGINLTADMHRRGIGVRHMGLLRDMFWRPLDGNIDLSFNSCRVRTKADLRRQLRRGDQVRVDGNIFRVSLKARHEFSASAITFDRKVEMMSRNNVPIFKGKVNSDINCTEIRRVLLAEMTARAAKNMLRQYLRISSAETRVTTYQTQVLLTVESLNIITGIHERSHHFWNERLLPIVRGKFGDLAIDHAEESNIKLLLGPCIPYIIQRLQEMMGFTLSNACASHFCNNPDGFRFTALDVAHPPIRIKHNAPMKELADASMLVLQANKVRATGYVQLVQMAGPELYLTLQERKGSRVAVNHGKGGIAISGFFVGPIKFERPGPIHNDPLNRAIHLEPASKCHVETRRTGKLLAPMQPHSPFSVEAWVKCEGGLDTTRYVVMTGRYALLATRENYWAASVCTEEGFELYIPGPHVLQGEWVYLVATYDGVVVRIYVNSKVVAQVELHAALVRTRAEKRTEEDRALAVIQEEENQARSRCKSATENEVDLYCKSREGGVKLARLTNKIREKADFARQMDRQAISKGTAKLSMSEAKAQARQEMKTDLYMKNVQKVAQEYKRRRDELEDLAAQEREEILERAEKSLRIGAMCRSKRSQLGRNFFNGDVCHVAVYLSALSMDAIRCHHNAGVQASSSDCDRLYSLAGAKFQAALAFAPDDSEIITRYAQSIINFLELESMQSKNPRRSQLMVEEAVEMFIEMENWDGLAVVFTQLPSGSFCRAFLATVEARSGYFSSSSYMSLKKLARMPKKFYLDLPGADDTMTEVAAAVYRLVLADLGLADIFGQTDLSWLPLIKSASAVVAMVLQAESDDDERVIDFEKYHVDCSDVGETDVLAVIDNRRLAVVLNLTDCRRVADRTMQHIAQMLVHLQAFTISGCQLVTDQHLDNVLRRNSGLLMLGLGRCPGVSTIALTHIPALCTNLRTVDLSHNASVTDDVLGVLAKCCRRLETLFLQYCAFLTDAGAQRLAVEVNHETLTSLDLSGCALISDFGVVALGQLCHKIRRLNLKAVNRVTESGASSITHNCWDLEYLCFEDMYNLVDSAFVFDFRVDGRRAVEANMLRRITDLNLHDCNKLTDNVVYHIMKRADQIISLNLAGCCQLTDAACRYIVEDPVACIKRGASLTSLNFGYCLNVTDEGISQLVVSLGRLRYVNLSGLVQLTDTGIYTLVSSSTQLQEIVLAQCKQLTDKTLCYLADFLWVENLDISHCTKMSDDGVEVAALEFAGLRRINLTHCSRLTERTLDVLSMYCPHLKTVELRHVSNCSQAAVDRFSKANPGLTAVIS